MMSAWTKWQISTAIDKGRPLSPSLARVVRRDPECRRFYEASLAMAGRLRRDADDVIRQEESRLAAVQSRQSDRPVARALTADHGRRRIGLAVAAAAAMAGLLLGGYLLWRGASTGSAGPEVAVEAEDVAELAEMLEQVQGGVDRAVQRSVPKWQRLLDRSRESLRGPLVREAENMETDARNILRAMAPMLTSEAPPEPPDMKPEDDPPPSSSDSHLPASRKTASPV